jgi:glycosyltransferase involved in cell wall biosynthesis
LEKILIISYFYPPCSLTASQRAIAYNRYLSSFGYYPLMVTRNWDHPIQDQKDMSTPSGNALRISKHEGFEVHELPFEPNFRERMMSKYGDARFRVFRKFLTFLELILQNFSINVLSYKSMYQYACNLIDEDPKLKKVIIITNPYPLYHIGYLLKKKYPRIDWIADYRDDWTTNKLSQPADMLGKLLRRLERKSERKWVNTASLATTVSQVLVDRLVDLLECPVHLVANGFFEEDYIDLKAVPSDSGTFIITYTGTLYPVHRIEVFIAALKRIVDESNDKMKIIARFIGLEFDISALNRVKGLFAGYEQHLDATGRFDNKGCLQKESESDALLICAFGDLKGIPASKLYQYLGHRKPVLLVPSDHDVIAEILEETGLGLICEDEEGAYQSIKKLIDMKLRGELKDFPFDREAVKLYSRRVQVKKMAGLLDGI